jgi:CxxC motif-containing protein
MSSELELTCIICPASCTLKVTVEGNKIVKVEGNLCPRGAEFAKDEISNPARYVMSVVKVKGGDLPTVSVITGKPVPKNCIWQVMEALAKVDVEAPVEIGDVVLRDICGTDIIATRRVKRVE